MIARTPAHPMESSTHQTGRPDSFSWDSSGQVGERLVGPAINLRGLSCPLPQASVSALTMSSRATGSIPARGAGTRLAQPPEYRSHLRHRGTGARSGFGSRAGRGADVGRAHRTGADAARRGSVTGTQVTASWSCR